MRYLALLLAAFCLVSCSRDPNVLKVKYLESGNKYFDAGRYKEASIMYRKSIEADRKYGPGYYHLALTDLKLGAVPSAVPALRRAHELLKPGTPDSDDTDLKLSEIIIVAAQGQENNEAILKEVHVMVDGLLKRNPNGWAGLKLSGDLAMLETSRLFKAKDVSGAKNELQVAIAGYRHALAAKPDNEIVLLALGRTLVVDGQIPEAQSLFKSLVAKNKNNLSGYFELYRVYLSQQQLPEAEAILKSAIANNPKSTQVRLTLAQFYYGANKRTELLALLSQMKADLKQFPEAYFQAGDFYARVNSFDDAVKQYEEGIQKDPARKSTYLQHEIEVFIREGRADLAYKQNEQILKEDPKNPEARGLKATFLLDKGDVNQAMTDLQSVVTAKPGNFVARFNLGRAHFARNELEQARQEFDEAVQLRPDYLPARLAQTQLALLRGDNDAALRFADAVLSVSPNSVQGTVMKAAALERLKRQDEARVLLTAVLEKNPKQVETLLELGLLDLNEKKIKEAQESFHRAWEADHTNLRGLLGESRTYLLDGHPDKAVQLVEAEVQKDPKRLDLLSALGNSQVNAGQVDTAIATFQSLLPKVPDPRQQADLWTRIGEAYLRKGDLQQSINAMEKARTGDPGNNKLTVDLAMLYEAQNKRDVARKYYEQAIKVESDNALALNNLAYLLAESNGDLEIALTYATRAKQKLPNHPEVNDTLGWIYLKKNLTDNAVDTFRTLVAQVPQSPTYHYHYAMALMQKGDRATAKKECQAALADKPRKEEEQQIHNLMARLG